MYKARHLKGGSGKTQSSAQSFLKGSFILTLSMVAVKLCGMVYKVMLANMYASFGEDFAGIGTGLFSNAYELYVPLFTLATAGFPVAVSRLISESTAQNRYKDIDTIHRVSKKLFLIMGLVCFAIMFFGSYIFVRIISQPYALYPVLALSPMILFGCLVSTYRGYFEGLRDMKPTAISEVIEACSKLFVGLGLSYLIMKFGISSYESTNTVFGLTFESEHDAMYTLLSFSAAGAIMGITLGSLLSFLFLYIRYRLDKNRIPKECLENSVEARSRKEVFSILVRTAIPIGVGALIMNIASTIDTVMVQRVLLNLAQTKPAQLLAQYDGKLDNLISDGEILIHTYLFGVYSNCITIMQIVTSVTQVFGTAAMPNVTAAYAKGDKTELKHSIETVLKITTVFTFPIGLGMFAIPYQIISLFYGGNIALFGTEILRVMGISVIFIACSTPLCSMLQAIGKVKIPMKLYAVAMTIKICLNYLFVGIVSINVVGAAVGTLIAYIFVCVVAVYCLYKYSGVRFNIAPSIIKPLISAVACAVSAYLFSSLFSGLMPAKVSSIAALLCAGIIYIVFLLLLRTFSENEIKMLPKGKKLSKLLAKLRLLG